MDTDFKIELSADSSQLETNIQSSLDKRTFKIKVVADNVDGQANISGASSVSGSKGLSKTDKSMASATMRTENLKAQLDRLSLSGKITTEQFDTFNKTLDEMSQKLSQDKKIDDFAKGTNTLNNAIKRTITENKNQVKTEKEVTRALQQKTKAQEKENKALEKAKLKKYNQDLKAQAKAEKEATKSKNELLRSATKVSNQIKRFGETNKLSKKQVADFSSQVDKLTENFKNGNIGVSDFTSGLQSVTQNVQGASGGIGEFARNVGSMIKGFAGFQLAATIIMQVINLVKQMVGEVFKLDKAMTELNKVSDENKYQLNSVKKEAFELANALGTTGENVLDAITEFKRMGYTMEESIDLAEVAVKMTNVAEGIDDAGEAANILTSILRGTNTEIKYADSLLDRLNEISNNNAISFDALANMTQEAAATMKILGNNLDQTMGLLTGAYAILGDESVATGIQTIGLRIAGLNEDMETVAGLSNQVVEALQKYAGISAFDEQTGQLKSTYEILEELAEVWDTIGKNQQSALLNTLAGKRQADVAASILNNWKGVQKAVEDASNSMGSANEEQKAYVDSLEGRVNQIKNWFQELADEAISSDTIKEILDLLMSVLKLVGSIVAQVFKALDIVIKLSGIGFYLKEIEGALNMITWFMEKINQGLDWIIDKIDKLIDKVKSVGSRVWNWVKGLFGFGKDKDDTPDLAETFKTEPVDEYTIALNKLKNSLFDYNQTLQDNIDLLDKQKKQYEQQEEIQNKILSIEKARAALAEAKQKRIRVFRAGVGFVYEADAAEVQSAQEDLTKAINDLAEYKYEYAYSRAKEFVEKLTELIQSENITKGWADLFDEFGDLLDTEFADYLLKAKEFILEFNNSIGVSDEPISVTSGVDMTNVSNPAANVNNAKLFGNLVATQPSSFVSSGTKGNSNSVIINGPINLPNVTDADGFIDAMVAIGNNSIPQFG